MKESIFAGKRCFVIMPFGQKKEKRPDGTEVEINFDYVYHELIKAAVESLGMECDRCDEIIDTGSIHAKMFRGIFEADVAVVDVSFMNPNVYYELGVRHALNKHTTLVIRKNSNQPPPFNISGLNVLGYDIDDSEKLEASRKTIREYVKNGLEKQTLDSLVHEYLDNLNIERKSKKIGKKEFYTYQILNNPNKQVGIVTGDLQEITEVDVWVNPENTDMQMARHFDRSISATIRYMGAIRDEMGHVTDDVIANELNGIAKGSRAAAGQVIATGSGDLKESHNVKKIFHAASVEGEMGVGYTPIKEIEKCIRNAMKKADSKELAGEDIKSILFPLMGTGTAKSSPEEIARKLIDTAISYIETNPQMKIERVFFLARNEEDLEICTDILNTHKSIAH
ncbi:MAG: macro domain-containing protein [Anaerolineales bacterium]|nr:macro domain-containing protein [Anaerolineales bacterium]